MAFGNECTIRSLENTCALVYAVGCRSWDRRMVMVLYGGGQDTRRLYLGVLVTLNGVSNRLNK